MSRGIREAPDVGVFNARSIRLTASAKLAETPWYRLAQTAYSDPFFANQASRFTPSSWHFPCVYLAKDKQTTVSEVFGDRMALAQAAGVTVFSIPRALADSYRYRTVSILPGDLKLCDLTDAETLQNTGLDIASYHLANVQVPQLWAERIANHPSGFDGIQYRSRHTDQHCLVIWIRPDLTRDLRREMTFGDSGPFRHSKEAYASAALRGLKLSFL